jgi:glyoxalase family protein
MTFFDWPRIRTEIRGTDSISGTAFRVGSREALDFWVERLDQLSISRDEISQFAGRDLLPFQDPEGQRLFLVNDQGAEFEGEIWPQPEIPLEYSLKGFFSIILTLPETDRLVALFNQVLGFSEIKRERWIDGRTDAVIFTTSREGGPGTEVWLLEQPELPLAVQGAGGTHHVAFRVDDKSIQQRWLEHLTKAGLHVSSQIDRFWFHSIYFRVSRGILFEIATDGPGFTIDETPENLGDKLVLPPFLEDRRKEIEAGLVPLGGG